MQKTTQNEAGKSAEKMIYVVDDNAINLAVAKEALEGKYRVRTFASAKMMFEVLKKEQPNLILLDIEMPDMDGFEALSKLKRNRLTKDIPIIFVTVLKDVETEVLGFQMGVVDFISKPFSSPVLRNRIKTHINTDEIIKERTADIQKLNNAFVHTLADMVEGRDENTHGHIERITSYIKILVESMIKRDVYTEELAKIDMDLLVSSARLHDVGKIAVPGAILNKPDKLTDDEIEIVQKHCEEGDKIINDIMLKTNNSELLQNARLIINAHHERWDGRGYPNGLSGASIPLQARIMAIVDVYDALVSKRSYKKAFTPEQAIEIIMQGAGNQFDPYIAESFCEAQELLEAIE